MPHISVKLFPGRDEQVKQVLAEALRREAFRILGGSADHISVSVEEVAVTDWTPVYEKEIRDNPWTRIRPAYDWERDLPMLLAQEEKAE